MSERESSIEREVSLYAESRGWYAVKIMRASKNGFPDHYYLRDGRTVLIEFKREGKGPRIQQEKRIRELREHGGEAFAVDNVDAAKAILK